MLKRLIPPLVILVFVMVIVAGVFLLYVLRGIPPVQDLVNFKVEQVNMVLDHAGRPVYYWGRYHRIYVPIEKIPPHVKNAFIAAEDAEFYRHHGINLKGMFRALVKDLLTGSFKQGGSSITQQLARTLLLSSERKIIRKLKEIYIAIQLERHLSKDRILELYLNQIYLGEGAYGVEAASNKYFGKSITEVSVGESAVLASLPKAPSYYSPYRHPREAMRRRAYVLRRMLEEGYITENQYHAALSSPIVLEKKWPSLRCESEYFFTALRKELSHVVKGEELGEGGLRIYTTLDMDLQCAASVSLKKALVEYSLRQELRYPYVKVPKSLEADFLKFVSQKEIYHRPSTEVVMPDGEGHYFNPVSTFPEEGKFYTGVVTGVSNEGDVKGLWLNVGALPIFLSEKDLEFSNDEGGFVDAILKKLKPGDVVKVGFAPDLSGKVRPYLAQEPYAEGAMVVVENKTGAIRALVGGFSFRRSPFNRAVDARRQTGSAFKPFVYTAALKNGWTPSSPVPDAPLVFQQREEGKVWKPSNYSERFRGMVPLRTALAKSINSVSVYLASKIGVLPIINTARELGIKGKLEEDLSMALGTSALTVEDMVSAFTVFPNLGVKRDTYYIEKIEDMKTGRLIYQHEGQEETVLSPALAYVMVSMLENVVREGTGWRARVLDFEVGGKTGTTDEQRDAWFIGFSRDYTAGVWVGRDDFSPLGIYETGSRAACPAWVRFMALASHLKGKPGTINVPPGLVFLKIDPKTGLRTRGMGEYQAYVEGTEPRDFAEDTLKGNNQDETVKEDFKDFNIYR